MRVIGGAETTVLLGMPVLLIYGLVALALTGVALALYRRRALETAGADHLIGGCTEVPLLLNADDVSAPLTDSAEVLAAASVRACA